MMQRKLAFKAMLVACAAVAAPLAAQAAAPLYTLTQLSFTPTGINGAGEIVGFEGANIWSPSAAVIRKLDGSVVSLGGLGGLGGRADAINANGVAVGDASSSPDGYVPSAVIYDHGKTTSLGAAGRALAINAGGQVVGTKGSFNSWENDPRQAFIYQNGTLSNLGTLGGSSFANGINDKGQATGGSRRDQVLFSAPHAVIFDKGAVKDLGTLGGAASTGQAINNAGQVTGTSGFNNEPYPTASTHAFLYINGQMKDLGTLGTDLNSYGWAINNAGTVVGWSNPIPSSSDHLDRAFIYKDGQLTDLNTLLGDGDHPVLKRAFGITDDGRIIGTVGGAGFLLTPVPEPEVPALVSVGLLAVGIALRHRRAKDRKPGA